MLSESEEDVLQSCDLQFLSQIFTSGTRTHLRSWNNFSSVFALILHIMLDRDILGNWSEFHRINNPLTRHCHLSV